MEHINQLNQMYYSFLVGGKKFVTSRDTLKIGGSDSLFSKIMEKKFQIDEIDGMIFLDRNPKYFSIILDYLRTGRIPQTGKTDLDFLNLEMDFFNLSLPRLRHVYIYVESSIYGAILTFSGLSKEESEKLTDSMRSEGNTYQHWMKAKGRGFLESRGWKFEQVVEDLVSQRYSYTFSKIVPVDKKKLEIQSEKVVIL